MYQKAIRTNEPTSEDLDLRRSREDPCVSAKRRVSSSTLILGIAISADALHGDAIEEDLPHPLVRLLINLFPTSRNAKRSGRRKKKRETRAPRSCEKKNEDRVEDLR